MIDAHFGGLQINWSRSYVSPKLHVSANCFKEAIKSAVPSLAPWVHFKNQLSSQFGAGNELVAAP